MNSLCWLSGGAGSCVPCPPGSERLSAVSPELPFEVAQVAAKWARKSPLFFFWWGRHASLQKLSLLVPRYVDNKCPLCLSEVVK